jgi:PPK2 family polyphosphate:nucleotide phosphotransferase
MNRKIPKVRPLPLNKPVDLHRIDPSGKDRCKLDKKESQPAMQELCRELADLQRLIYAEHKRSLLVVLQGMDTSGKNGTIRNVFHLTDPVGVHVASYKKPSELELDHDFLWRIHAEAPKKGDIGIFDRSHYEDITAVRVHQLAPEKTWRRRFKHINDFERLLTDEGTVIIKVFLHIDPNEQKRRLQSRLDEPNKLWKFDASDLHARQHWDDYMVAYNDALTRTNTRWARWHVVPANHKWLRNLMVARIVVDTLNGLGMGYPTPVIPDELTQFD